MDRLVPELMGVTPAILENVIFCHQEDVNWPLSESRILKEKFDEIFSSTRYTKALEAIKKVKKTQSEDVKNLSTEVAVLKVHKVEFGIKSDQIKKKKKDIEEYTRKINEIAGEISELEKTKQDFEKIRETQAKLKNKLVQDTKEKELLTKTIQDIRSRLEQEYEESDQHFASIQSDFQNQLDRLVVSKEEKTNILKGLVSQREKDSSELNRLNSTIGALEEAQMSFDAKSLECNEIIHHIAVKLNLTVPISMEFVAMETFSKSLESKLLQLKQELKNLKMEHKAFENSQNDVIGKLTSKLASSKSILTSNTRKMTDLDSKNKMLSKSLSNTSNEDQLSKLALNLRIEQDLIQKKESAVDYNKTKSVFAALKSNIDSDVKQLSDLSKSLKNMENQQSIVNKIKDLNEEKSIKENLLWKEMESLKSVVRDADPSKITKEIQNMISNKEQVITSNAKVSMSLEKKKALLMEKKRTLEESIANSIKSLEEKDARIKKMCKQREFDYVLQKFEKQVSSLLSETSMLESLKVCYEKFMEQAQHHNKCPVCDRGMNHDELTHFLQIQNSKLKEAPEMLNSKKTELIKYQDVLAQLRDLKPIVTEVSNLKTSQIEMETKKKSLESEIAQVEQEEKGLLSNDSLLSELNVFKKHLEVAIKVSHHYDQILQIQEKIHMEKQKQAQFELSGSFDDLIKIKEQVSIRLEKTQTEYDLLWNQSNSIEKELNALRASLYEKQNEMNRLNSEHEKNKRDLEQIERNKNDINELERLNSELTSTILPLEKEISRETESLNSKRRENEQVEINAQSAIDEYQRHYATLSSIFRDLTKFQSEQKSTQLKEVHEKINKLQIKATERNEHISTYTSEIESIQEMISGKNRIAHNLSENVRLRSHKKQLILVEQSFANTTRDLQNLSPLDDKQIQGVEKKYLKLTKEQSELAGAKKAVTTEMESIQHSLKKEEYQQIDDKYKFSLIKLKTVEKASSDLEKYYNALNQALMKYHTMKMDEINEIIKELWQKTYRGQDIDCIQIRAETSDSGRQAYNYRVVMVKGNIALDMKGRCSAGQKVLACLIIRLALAEAFCVECGIIALDEPTTNLDSENVSSLAQSLQLIIGERGRQSNFQLIVITHDEDFVQKIGRSSFVDKYYRVSKDPETQTSRITEHLFVENK